MDSFETKKLAQKSVSMKAGAYGTNGRSGVHLPSATGAIPKKAWENPAELLGKLTQTPGASPTWNSPHRCGPSNLLGAALMAGPEHAAKFLTGIASSPDNKLLSSAERQELREIAQRIADKKATFEDLGRAQDLLYRAGNKESNVDDAVHEALTSRDSRLGSAERNELTRLAQKPTWNARDAARVGELLTKASGIPSKVIPDPGKAGTWMLEVSGGRSGIDISGYGDRELSDLARMGGIRQQTVAMDGTRGVKDVFSSLKPGESAVLRVAGDDESQQPDHFVTIGRRADGTAYIYNPDPAKGDPTLFIGDKGKNQPTGFLKQLQKYEDRLWGDPNGQFPSYTIVSPG